MKSLHKFLLSTLCAVAFTGCSLNIPPPDQFSDPEAITNVESARSLLTSAYIGYPHYEYDLSKLGNDFCPTSLSGKDIDQQNFYRWQDNSISKFASDVWLAYYNTIAICDVLIERLPAVSVTTSDETKEKAAITSEVQILRAKCYFNLLRLFSPAYDRNPDANGIILKNRVGLEFPSRTSVRECTKQIRGWLTEAAQTNNMPEENGWLSARAAHYLLAELELYAGNYAEAAAQAEIVLQGVSDNYLNDVEDLWSANNYAGRIFAFNTTNTYYADIQYDAEEGDYFAVNPAFVFDDTDVRKSYTLYPFTIDGAERNLLGKYNKNNKEEKSNAYIDMIRYAGAYFIAAEAYSRIGGNENKGRTLINHYLTAVGAQPIAEDITGEALTEAILKEKQKEFIGEGVNYFDLKRTHSNTLSRLNTWGNSNQSSIATNDYRWTFPIPASEYRYNENVTQNEGWPINR